MTTKEEHCYPKTGINHYVAEYIKTLPNLTGKFVLDIPCGDGRASYEFFKKGATVKAFDLFPGFMKLNTVKAEYADLTGTLPIESNSIDYIICQEGIEHVPNQLRVLEEFNRVLKTGGTLLITAPHLSHVRARIAHFFLESDCWTRMPPTEIDSIWFAENNSNKLYFGHFFLPGAQHLQSLLTLSGFQVTKRIKTDLGNASLGFGVLLYPVFVFVTFLSWVFYRRKNIHIPQRKKDQIFWERIKLNLSPKTLFCKHIFWVLKKESELNEITIKLKNMRRE